MGYFFISVALVVVSGNNLGFYLHILSATFWKWQNNACNTHLTTQLILYQSAAVMDNYNRMLSFHHLPSLKELIQLWTCREKISSETSSLELLTKEVTMAV